MIVNKTARASKAVRDYASLTLITDLEEWKKEDLHNYLRHSIYIRPVDKLLTSLMQNTVILVSFLASLGQKFAQMAHRLV